MPTLETLRLTLLVLHLLGLAALIGPALIQPLRAERTGLRVMLIGAVVQVLSGNGLIAANQLQGMHVIEAKMIVKLALALLSLLLLIVVARRREAAGTTATTSLQNAAGGLGIAALAVAVVWS